MNVKLLTTALLFYPVFTYAQDFNYSPVQHRVDTVANENYASFNIQIETDVPQAIKYGWELVSNTLDTNWSYSLCDYNGCFVGIPQTGLMSDISLADAQNGIKGFFILNITVGQFYGSGKAVIYVYDSEDFSKGDSVSFEVHWFGTSTGITSPELDPINVFPNPTNGQFSFANSGQQDLTYSVYNMIGELLRSDIIQAGVNHSVDLSGQSDGIYILSYTDQDGNTWNRRIVKE